MIEKQGYIFTPEVKRIRTLFGKSENSKGYENIETNNFSFFENINELQKSITHFKKLARGEIKISKANLQMQIAESEKEADTFTNRNLVVICDMSTFSEKRIEYLQKRIYGLAVKGKPQEFNGLCSRIDCNGLKTFYWLGETFEINTAKYTAREIHRQGDNAPVTIAKFKLEFLD